MAHTHLTSAERPEISILLGKKYSPRRIAKVLGRDHSTLSREVSKNKVEEAYFPRKAGHKAYTRRKYSKYQGMKVEDREDLKQYVITHLELHWTPEEISGRLKHEDKELPYISAKGIYRWLYSSYGQRYCFLLPKQHFSPKRRRGKKTERSLIPNRVDISERPAGANDRSEFGHFETDTVVSGKRTGSKAALGVLVERKARYTRLRKLPNLRPKSNNRALKKMAKDLKMSTLTYDNGIENREHRRPSD